MNTSPRDRFYEEIMKETSFTEKRIKTILSGRYNTFDVTKIEEYKEVILNIHTQETEQAAAERVKDFKLPDPIPCPICSEPTIGDISLRGVHTKEPGWRCSKGGSNHYWQYRAQKSASAVKERSNVTN